ncbi:unnamed protein product [Mesocestoides corti]|uniref:Ig-like domain-containing protein n=1 Tax=Mesocestoides corti TaxID=53468 RepID=A0A0R3UGG0_MESCO|nr:unnamed protein product [Mesocestoides corti]
MGSLLLLLLVLSWTVFSLRCPPPPTAGLFACRNRSLREVPLPVGAPTKSRLAITALDVSDNAIEILHKDALRPYPALTSLWVERNVLWKITDLAFHSVPGLESLLLRGNRLVIQPGSLSPLALLKLKHLKKLDLSDNPLGLIPTRFFAPSLIEVRLERTIPGLVIKQQAFSGLHKLRVLSLADNRFESLPAHLSEELGGLKNLQRLHLHGNRWNCDCHLAWLGRLARRLNETTSCHKPAALQNRVMSNLPPREFQCAPSALNKNATTNRINEVETGATVTMVCNFYAEPRGRITWYRGDQVLGQAAHETMVTDTIVQTNLTLTDVRVGHDDGLYRCEAENARGKDSILFRIKVGYFRAESRRLIRVSGVMLSASVGGGVLLVSLTLISILVYCYQKDKTEHRPRQAVAGGKCESEPAAAEWEQQRALPLGRFTDAAGNLPMVATGTGGVRQADAAHYQTVSTEA